MEQLLEYQPNLRESWEVVDMPLKDDLIKPGVQLTIRGDGINPENMNYETSFSYVVDGVEYEGYVCDAKLPKGVGHSYEWWLGGRCLTGDGKITWPLNHTQTIDVKRVVVKRE